MLHIRMESYVLVGFLFELYVGQRIIKELYGIFSHHLFVNVTQGF